jgi:hypothetical protein
MKRVQIKCPVHGVFHRLIVSFIAHDRYRLLVLE